MSKSKRPFYKKKKFIVPAILIVVLVAFRIYLPTLAKNYVNKVLADIPGYYGQVDDIDLALYRGAYTIKGMFLDKADSETREPFLDFPLTEISVEWKSLFNGKIVAEITMTGPEVTYVFEEQQQDTDGEDADAEDWTKALTDIVPLDINHFEIHGGKLSFVQLSADPDVDLSVRDLELTMDNLRNVVAKDRTLPSTVKATAVSFGDGNVNLNGKMNIVKEVPDMDISLSLEKAKATALNDFTRHYAGIDFDGGTVELYSEVAIADGSLKGYLKPLLINSKLIGKEDGFLETLWEGFVGFFKFVLKNQRTDTLATEIPLEGDLNNPQAGFWPTLGGIFRNAWIDAFQGETNDTIEYEDAFEENADMSKKEKRKAKKAEKEK